MKRGSMYAKRIKRLYQDLLKKHGKPEPVEPTDPIEQMLTGILSIDTTIGKGQAAFRKLMADMVDLNELRVTPALEMAQMMGSSMPMALDKARRIVDALNAVRKRQDSLDLTFLRQRGRREAREYLETLDGLVPSVAALVVLFSLGGHAIPVDNLALYVLRKEDLVHPDADIPTVQAFLERHISAADASRFVRLLDHFVIAHGSRVAVEKLPQLLFPPPEPVAPPVQVTPPDKEAAAPEAKTKKAAQPKAKPAKAGAKKTKPPAKKKAASARKVAKKTPATTKKTASRKAASTKATSTAKKRSTKKKTKAAAKARSASASPRKKK